MHIRKVYNRRYHVLVRTMKSGRKRGKLEIEVSYTRAWPEKFILRGWRMEWAGYLREDSRENTSCAKALRQMQPWLDKGPLRSQPS